jgi:hypothetical protein
MLHISHCQTTAYHPESNGAVKRLHRCLKDALRERAAAATWSEELPLGLLGLRAQPREDTDLSLAEGEFSALQLSCPTNFCMEMNFMWMQLLTKFLKLWMLLLFPCPGTIPAPGSRPSCQKSCCAPPSSGCAVVASPHLSIAPMMAPMPSCSLDPAPSPSRSGHGTRTSPSAASRPAWKRTPHLAVQDAAADLQASALAVPPPPSGSHFQTRWFPHLPSLRCCQATVQEPIFWSRAGFLHALDLRHHPSLHSSGNHTVSGHRLRD